MIGEPKKLANSNGNKNILFFLNFRFFLFPFLFSFFFLFRFFSFFFFLFWPPCSIWSSWARDQIPVTVATHMAAATRSFNPLF